MTSDSKQRLRDLCARRGAAGGELRLAFLRDPEGRARAAFNARWLPRAFVLDRQGRIVYVQPDTLRDDGSAAAVSAAWSGPDD